MHEQSRTYQIVPRSTKYLYLYIYIYIYTCCGFLLTSAPVHFLVLSSYLPASMKAMEGDQSRASTPLDHWDEPDFVEEVTAYPENPRRVPNGHCMGCIQSWRCWLVRQWHGYCFIRNVLNLNCRNRWCSKACRSVELPWLLATQVEFCKASKFGWSLGSFITRHRGYFTCPTDTKKYIGNRMYINSK